MSQLALLARRVARGPCAVINPFGAVLTQNKRMMALLWEEIWTRFAPLGARESFAAICRTPRAWRRFPCARLRRKRRALGVEVGLRLRGRRGRHRRRDARRRVGATCSTTRCPTRWIAQRRFQPLVGRRRKRIANYGVYLVGGQAAGIFTALQSGHTDRGAICAPTLVRLHEQACLGRAQCELGAPLRAGSIFDLLRGWSGPLIWTGGGADQRRMRRDRRAENDSTSPCSAALDLQQQDGWNVGSEGQPLVFPGARDTDITGGTRAGATRLTDARAAPAPGEPTLATVLQPDAVPVAGGAAQRRPADGDSPHLHARDGLATGAAKRCCPCSCRTAVPAATSRWCWTCPVPRRRGRSRASPAASIRCSCSPTGPTRRAWFRRTRRWPRRSTSCRVRAPRAGRRPATAPPVFVLDRQRLAPYADDAGQFDNRYFAGLPSWEGFHAAGIRHVLYVTPDDQATLESDDLNDDLVALDEGGIDVKLLALSDFSQTPLPGWAEDPGNGCPPVPVSGTGPQYYFGGSPASQVALAAGTGADPPQHLAGQRSTCRSRCHCRSRAPALRAFRPFARATPQAMGGHPPSGRLAPRRPLGARHGFGRSGSMGRVTRADSAPEAVMRGGIFGHAFVDLERYVDLDELAALDDEIYAGPHRGAGLDYTGGSHKTMGIVPPSERDDPFADYGEAIAAHGPRPSSPASSRLSDTPEAFELDRQARVRVRRGAPMVAQPATDAVPRVPARRLFSVEGLLRADAGRRLGRTRRRQGQDLHRRGAARVPADHRLHRTVAVRATRPLQPAGPAVERSRDDPPRRGGRSRGRPLHHALSARQQAAVSVGRASETRASPFRDGPTGSTIASITVLPPPRSFATRFGSTACSTARFLGAAGGGPPCRPALASTACLC